jgi:hypothetical protein
MSALAFTTVENAVTQLKTKFAGLVSLDDFAAIEKEEPDLFFPEPGKPVLTMLYAGAANDGQGYQHATVPPILTFNIRIFHQLEPWRAGLDPFQTAQRLCIKGDSLFEAALMANPNLDDLVTECRVESVQVGELLDREGHPYWGHELFISVEVH